MKSLVILSFVLVLGAFGPQRGLASSLDALWILGMLGLVAFLFHQIYQRLSLAPVAAWLFAGLLLGVGGLRIVTPEAAFSTKHVFALAAIWVGFDVGIRFRWGPQMRWTSLIATGSIGFSTGAIVTAALAALLGVPVWVALVFGALSSLWGPVFASANGTEEEDALFVSLVGAGIGLALLTFVLAISYSHGPFGRAGLQFAGNLCLSLACGVLAAEVIRTLRFFSARPSALAVALAAVAVIAAAVIADTGLFAAPFGLAAGASLSWSSGISRRSRAVLETSRPIALMILFALIGASIDPFAFASAPRRFAQILLVQVVALVAARTLLPRLSRYLALGDGRKAWMWMPRGVLAFELVAHLNGSTNGLLPAPWAELLRQIVHAEILLHGFVLSPLVLLLMRRGRRQPPPVPESGSAAAIEPS